MNDEEKNLLTAEQAAQEEAWAHELEGQRERIDELAERQRRQRQGDDEPGIYTGSLDLDEDLEDDEEDIGLF